MRRREEGKYNPYFNPQKLKTQNSKLIKIFL